MTAVLAALGLIVDGRRSTFAAGRALEEQTFTKILRRLKAAVRVNEFLGWLRPAAKIIAAGA